MTMTMTMTMNLFVRRSLREFKEKKRRGEDMFGDEGGIFTNVLYIRVSKGKEEKRKRLNDSLVRGNN